MNKVFFDSNIFVYSVDESNPKKQKIARNLLEGSIQGNYGIISTQNLQEMYNACTKKLKISGTDTKKLISVFASVFPVVQISLDVILKAADIHLKTGFSFYDSLIIATAVTEGCIVCYSEDMNNNQIIEGVKIINPFIQV